MAQILPFSAISGHFVKKIYNLTRQPLCFHHFARPWPLTSRPAAAGSGAARVSKRLPLVCPATAC